MGVSEGRIGVQRMSGGRMCVWGLYEVGWVCRGVWC